MILKIIEHPIYNNVTYISWSIDFALCHCHLLKNILMAGVIRDPLGTCSGPIVKQTKSKEA